MLLRQDFDHPLEEGLPVAGGERVCVLPVDFELAIGVFVVGGVRLPAEFLHIGDEPGQQVEIAMERSHVVTGFLRSIHNIPGNTDSVGPALEQHELGLSTYH